MEYHAKSLRNLISGGTPRHISAIFKTKLSEINEAKKNGFTNRQIIEALNNEGIKISESTFKSYLSRFNAISIKRKKSDNSKFNKKTTLPDNSPDESSMSSIKKSDEIEKIKNMKSNNVDIDSLSKLFKEIK